MTPRIISDIELFDEEERGFTHEEYQLLYGLVYYTQLGAKTYDANLFKVAPSCEENLYNLSATLFNQYIEYPILLSIKVEKWCYLLDELRGRVLQIQDGNSKKGLSTEIYFPYFGGGNPFGSNILFQSIDIVKTALIKMNAEKQSVPLEIFTKNKRLKEFSFPLEDIEDFFIAMAEHSYQMLCDKTKQWGSKEALLQGIKEKKKNPLLLVRWERVEQIFGGILWEMKRRELGEEFFQKMDEDGFDYTSSILTPENEWNYQVFFLQRENRGSEEEIGDDEEIEQVKEISAKKRTGVLRYMLESYGVKDKEKARKIIHFALYHGSKKYKVRVDSNDTTYNYLHNDKQLYKLVGDIEDVLREYDVPIPEGLKELDKRVFD